MVGNNIQLAHGGGGLLGNELIEKMFVPILDNPILNKLNDQRIFEVDSSRIAITTDSYVVKPIFFPGGSIGELAVNGTVNDLAMGGALPLYLSLGLIIEEGFPLKDLEKILKSVKRATEAAGVHIVTGDTKVVESGAVDGIFINTSGVGIVDHNLDISSDNLQVGDKIIINGYIGDHGIAILAVREGLIFEKPILSDTAPLNKLVASILQTDAKIHAMRDPTCGGLSSTLNEFARRSNVGIIIEESKLPIREEVAEACEIIGLDPLYVANEGKMVIVVQHSDVETVLQVLKNDCLGGKASVIGEVTDSHRGKVLMNTKEGITKVVDMYTGEQLPRIC